MEDHVNEDDVFNGESDNIRREDATERDNDEIITRKKTLRQLSTQPPKNVK